MADGEVGAVVDPHHPTRHDHPVAGQRRGQGIGHRRRRPGLEAPGPEADVGHHLVTVGLGVTHQGDRRPVDGGGGGRGQARPGGVPQAGGQQEAPHGEQPRSAQEQRRQDHGPAERPGHRPGPPGPGGHGEGHQHRGPVAHPGGAPDTADAVATVAA